MRILSKRQLKELDLYSPQHVARLEKAGEFPKRVQLGPNRVGWVEDEVMDWLQQRLECRCCAPRLSTSVIQSRRLHFAHSSGVGNGMAVRARKPKIA